MILIQLLEIKKDLKNNNHSHLNQVKNKFRKIIIFLRRIIMLIKRIENCILIIELYKKIDHNCLFLIDLHYLI